jgi:hypothetical protein
MKHKPAPEFRNVDLEIVSSKSLDILGKVLESRAVVLYCGKFFRRHLLSLESLRCWNTPDAAARDLCRVVEQLSPAARVLWDNARSKESNVGYELRADCHYVQVGLHPETVRRIVALGGTVAFTCYHAEETGTPKKKGIKAKPSECSEC